MPLPTCDNCVRQPDHFQQQLQQGPQELRWCADSFQQLLYCPHDNSCMPPQLLGCNKRDRQRQQQLDFPSSGSRWHCCNSGAD
jgi:hypothetical protein